MIQYQLEDFSPEICDPSVEHWDEPQLKKWLPSYITLPMKMVVVIFKVDFIKFKFTNIYLKREQEDVISINGNKGGVNLDEN